MSIPKPKKSKKFTASVESSPKTASLESPIETLTKKQKKQEFEKYKKQAEENLVGWQRTQADFLNYKKDQEKYLEEFRKYVGEDMIVKLLPTIDNFELATKHLPKDLENSDWVKGIICIKSQFDNFLKEVSIEEIKAIGEKFDPNLFESVGEEESDQEEGTIITEIQKGYKMCGKVIRVAKVVVAIKNSK
ncbi:MAG: nucleotide exchange factor GrpE [Patescibacteria group bacterium]|nr:nucleotide exchange factor GrpE [Patescibacteria group bacterium]